MTRTSALGGFEDWPGFVRSAPLLAPRHGQAATLAALLGIPGPISVPVPRTLARSTVAGVDILHLTWQLPFGPPTRAFLLAPAGTPGPLPGVLWLHCHAGNKFLGAERLVDFGADSDGSPAELRARLYEGRAQANALARTGFAVLVHDAFSWGSRRFALDPAPPRTEAVLAAHRAQWRLQGHRPTPEQEYNAAAADHENTIAKAAGLLGTTYAGMVAYEDLTALALLRSMPRVDPARVGAGGFSGGGGRALLLAALAPEVRACVVACMMTTFDSLLPAYLDAHSWLLHSPGLAAAFDWPDLAAVAPSARFLVQYAEGDSLFPAEGMHAADAALERGLKDRYRARWYSGGHVYSTRMSDDASDFLSANLATPRPPGPA